jgi:outer membrane protein OmpA-like peptidoglycan-associated protein
VVTRTAVLLGLLATLCLPASARAGNPPLNANFFRPAVHPGALLNVDTTLMPDAMAWGVGAFFSYEYHSLRLEDPQGGKVYQILRDVAKADVYGHFAPTRWLDIGLDVPVFLFIRGDSPPAGAPLTQVKGTSLGDLRLGLKFRILGGNGEGFGLAVSEDLTFPTATGGNLGGDRYVTSTTLLVGGYNRRGWDVALNVGVRLKAPVKFLDTEPGTLTGHQLLMGLGLSAPLICGRLEAIGTLEARTRLTAPFQSSQHDALDLMAGLRGQIGPVSLTAAGGGGVLAGFGSPLGRVLIAVAYAPPVDRGCGPRAERPRPADEEPLPMVVAPPADRDGDGVIDSADACPDAAGLSSPWPKRNGCPSDRDEDGFPDLTDACPDLAGVANRDPLFNGCPPDRDGDGYIDVLDVCPDQPGDDLSGTDRLGCPADRDGDGILDFLDACPDVAGIARDDPMLNGCPKTTPQRQLVIGERAEFVLDSATLTVQARQVLDIVVNTLVDHPEVTQIRIQGHTDDLYSLAHNVRLSRARAMAVRNYLVGKGIAPARLVTEGYADTRPLDTRDTEEARRKNRRVDFMILGP